MWNKKNDLPKLSCTNSQLFSHGQYENYNINKMSIKLDFNEVRKGFNKNHTYLKTVLSKDSKWKKPKTTIQQIRTNK